MERFARTAQRIAERPGKLDKVALLAEYFRELDDADLLAAARFFSGTPFAARDRRTLSLGGRTIVETARRVYGFDDAALGEGYRATGDLGAAIGTLVRPPADAMLFRDRLTPATLEGFFGEIAAAEGKNANKRRAAVLERILRACDDPLVATYVVKIVTGDLRVGLREGLVLDAIARAFDAEPAEIRRALMASGDVGAVALAAKRRTLHDVRVELRHADRLHARDADTVWRRLWRRARRGLDRRGQVRRDSRAGARPRRRGVALLAPPQRRDGVVSRSCVGARRDLRAPPSSTARSSPCATAASLPFRYAAGAAAAQERRRRAHARRPAGVFRFRRAGDRRRAACSTSRSPGGARRSMR